MRDAARHVSWIRVVCVIARREVVRFIRQPARIAAAVGTPLLLWAFLASGFTDAMRSETVHGTSYAAFLLPGMIALVAVFAAIFSAISVIDDRHAGWLQAAMVSPAPRWSLALGQVVGGACVAFLQGALLLLALPMLDVSPSLVEVALACAAVVLTCLAMSALGVFFAWRMETTAAFHAVMNLVFMPLWLLSGAFTPTAGTSGWFTTIVQLNPLAWCTEAIRAPLLGQPIGSSLALAAAFAALMICSAIWLPRRSNV